MSVNKVIIVGRLGNDPEVRQFQNGGSVTNISVATSERWTDKNTGERREQTEWHRISLFNRLGEIAAQYLRKGSMVYIEGSLHTRKYTDQQNIERYSTEIRASEMRMLGGGNNDGYGQGQGGYNQGYNNQYNAPSNPSYQNNQNYNNQSYARQNPQGQQAQPLYDEFNQDHGYLDDYNQDYAEPKATKNAPSNNFGTPKTTTKPSQGGSPAVQDDDMPF